MEANKHYPAQRQADVTKIAKFIVHSIFDENCMIIFVSFYIN